MEASVAKLEQSLEATNQSLARLYTRVDKIEEKVHALDLSELKQTHHLKTLISEAVLTGSQKSSEAQQVAFAKLEAKLDDIKNNYDKRLRALEEREEKKELEALKAKDAEKKANRKHIRMNVIIGIVMFFLAIILNNVVFVIADILANP